jgi:hypothetical protein
VRNFCHNLDFFVDKYFQMWEKLTKVCHQIKNIKSDVWNGLKKVISISGVIGQSIPTAILSRESVDMELSEIILIFNMPG